MLCIGVIIPALVFIDAINEVEGYLDLLLLNIDMPIDTELQLGG